MKTLIYCIVNGFFAKENQKKTKCRDSSIFIQATDFDSKTTIIVEEGPCHVWAYMLTDDKKEIAFNGFLCTVVSPVNSQIIDRKKAMIDNPLPVKIANKYSWVKKLRKEHITIEWKNNFVIIRIKGKVYLVMDKDLKISHSKALSFDCEYGRSL